MTVGAFFYRIYALTVLSEFPLAEAETCEPAEPDVRIFSSDLSHLARPVSGFRDFDPLAAGDLFSFRDVGSFLVRGGNEIAVDLDPQFDRRLVALPLLGPVIAVLLHRRGHLVLHGSAIDLNGKVAVFLGDKGAGKSTTAASLVAAGHRLIADDVVAVRLDRTVPEVAAGYQAMKLDTHMAASFGAGAGQVIEPSDGAFTQGKIRFRLDRPNPSHPLSLGGVYVLARGSENRFLPYRGVEALQALIRFSYFPRLGPAALRGGEAAALFAKAADLSGRAGVGQLVVRDGLDTLVELPAFLQTVRAPAHALA